MLISRRVTVRLLLAAAFLTSLVVFVCDMPIVGVRLRSTLGVPAVPASHADERRIRLALFCLERTGSTWLTSMLNSNPGVSIVAEPLSRLQGGGATEELVAIQREVAAVENSSAGGGTLLVTGFNEKLLSKRYRIPSDPAHLGMLRKYLVDNDFRVVLLMRKNFVSQAVSMIQAVKLSVTPGCGSHGWSRVNQTGWEDVCGAAHRRVIKEPVSISDLQSNLEDVRAKSRDILKTVSNLNMPRLTIYYEDLARHPAKVLRSISYWIGLNSSQILRPGSSIFLKQGADKLTEIANYEEMRFFLSKYSPCLLRAVDESLLAKSDISMCL